MVHLDSRRLYVLEMTGFRLIILLLGLMSCHQQEVTEVLEVPEVLPEVVPFEDTRIDPRRCSYEDCVCTVKIPPYKTQYVRGTNKSWESVFFQEAQFEINEDHARDVNDFMSSRMDVDSVLVVGYTDGCGSYDYNSTLSKNRAIVVSNFIKGLGYRGSVTTVGMSEMTSNHSDLAKRADIITSQNFRMEVPPPNLVADHYLLDASGSVQDYPFWVNIIAANKKPSSKLHLSYTRSCSNGTLASMITPSGPTEIWWSYWQVLDKMRPGQTLLILSDFDSRYPLTHSERRAFENKVNQKGVKVYAIRL